MSVPSSDSEAIKLPFKERLVVYGRFLRLAYEANPGLFFVRTLVIVGSAFCGPLQVYYFTLLISAISQQATDKATFLIVLSIVTYGARRLFDGLRESEMDSWFARSTSLFAQEKVLAHLGTIDPARLQDPRLRRDFDLVRAESWRINNLSARTEAFLRYLLQFLGTIGLTFLAPWWVTIAAIADACLQAIRSVFESRKDIWAAMWNSTDGRQVEYVNETFMRSDELRELSLLGATSLFMQRFHGAAQGILQRFRHAAVNSSLFSIGTTVFHVFVYTLVMVVFGRRAFQSPAELATLYVGLNIIQLFGDSLTGFFGSVAKLNSDVGILSRIDDLFRFPSESSRGMSIPHASMVVEFRDVSYRYAEGTKYALSHVNLIIRENEHIAVVGENGAGKSTFLRLLSGLDQPTSGEILLNGKPLSKYKRPEWRRAFHLMLQGAKLYQDFIEANVQYGKSEDKTFQKHALPLQHGLEVSGADAVVREVPQGLQAFIGDWAAPPEVIPQQVSGGQQQRLLIARTLIHGGRILGFDEPTSAMDALAETSFFEKLHDARQGKGLLYISHRFSTVRRASRILVFDQGQLKEDGAHEELLEQKGFYAKLYQEQAKWYQS